MIKLKFMMNSHGTVIITKWSVNRYKVPNFVVVGCLTLHVEE